MTDQNEQIDILRGVVNELSARLSQATIDLAIANARIATLTRGTSEESDDQ